MAFDLIISNITKHISLNEEETSCLIGILKQKELSKKGVLLNSGQTCKSIYFVSKGTLRSFYTNADGKEATIMFAVADWWITDMYCFINRLPAMQCIEAIEQSTVLELTKTDLDKLYLNVPKFERFFRILMENAYIREQLRMIQNLSLSAEDRYHNFITKYPHVARQVTLKQIASYLGITPEFLSTIRSIKTKR